MAKDLPQLKEYLDNKNVQWFIYNILKNESDKTSDGKINTGGYNQNAGNSSAFGAGQFIGSTRNNILKEYNIDAWSPDLEEQKLAIVALLDNVRQLDQIKKGDFSSQYDSKKGQWEAFHNKKGILDNKPNKWETEYTTLSETAVYRPDESWAKIPEDIKVKKLDLFENKYKGLPTEIVNPIDNVLDPTAQALGLPTSEDLQSQLYSYNAIKEYEDLAASDPNIVVPLPNDDYDPNKSISEQYLKFNPELTEYFQGAGNIPSVPINTQPASTESSEDLQTKVQAYNDLKSYDDAVA
ncbi:MAG: lysozyme family protein, partial [Planctomycetota bacterium]